MTKLVDWLRRRSHPLAFTVITIVVAVATFLVNSSEEPNKLASGILQVGTLLFGIYSSYLFGQISAEKAAMEIVRPHARSAFRRSLNLYKALGRQKNGIQACLSHLEQVAITTRKANKDVLLVEFTHVKGVLQGLESVVIEQISTADDALEDWRDLVPNEVAEIEATKRRLTTATPVSPEARLTLEQLESNDR